jgi:hypothetical protein
VWVCGDAAEDTQYVIVAAAEGAKAAMGINQELLLEDQGLEISAVPNRT